MGCRSCKGSKSEELGDKVEKTEASGVVLILKKIIAAPFALIFSIIISPVFIVIMTITFYKTWFGNGINISEIIKLLTNKKGIEKNEVNGPDLNEEDYELVSVDKIED